MSRRQTNKTAARWAGWCRKKPVLQSKFLFDQGCIGGAAANEAGEHGVELHVVKLPEAKRGFVLLPRRWVVERSFSWAARFRRLARAYEKLPQTLAGLHDVAFAMLMLPHPLNANRIIQGML